MRLEGQKIGRYYLQHLLGSGGMGEVYLAEDARIEQQVAIKVVRSEATPYPDIQTNREETNLFIREAKAVAKLDHPNILPLFDYGEEHIGEMNITYIVMPYRKEGSLATWLRQRSSGALLSVEELTFFLSQASAALQHAHDHAIIHQDVKPSNFLLRERKDNPNHPDLLLADFGVAKFYSATSNVSATIRGTPTYMAPEQWRGRPVFATDQYALAVMFYQLLVGRPPFHGGLEQIMYMHMNVQPPLPSAFNSQIPASIDAVLMRALEKNPDDRFPSVSAFAQAFQAIQPQRSDRPSQVSNPPTPPVQLFSANTPAPPTPMFPTNTPVFSPELRATLAISQAEAVSGTFRTLTLPGGRRVIVPVQAGAYDGQVIRLDGMGGQTNPSLPAGPLVIILTIANERDASGPPFMQRQSDEERTEMSTHTPPSITPPPIPPPRPHVGEKTILASSTSAASANTTPDFNRAGSTPPLQTVTDQAPRSTQRRRPSRLQIALLLALVLLIIIASAGIFAYITTNNQIQASYTHATATAQASVAEAATATASWFPYPPNMGNLVLNDPLTDNSLGYNWSRGYTRDDAGTECIFHDGAYHVVESNAGRIYYCVAQKSNFSNFTFQVQMTFVQGSVGDYGGIIFRSAGARQYFFRLGRDGSYLLKLYIDDTTGQGSVLKEGFSPAISTRLHAANILAVVARGGNFDVYVNHQHVTSFSDVSYSQGQIGLVAEDEVDTTDVAFSNAKVWALPS